MNGEGQLIRIFPTLNGRNLTVDDIDLEIAVRNALKRNGIHTLDQLLRLSHPELIQIFPNRKLRSYEDVIHRLACLSEEAEGVESIPPVFIGRYAMSNKKFNIFQVAGIWKSEEIHTSVIAELINPQSAFHDKGADFLDKFLLWIGKPLLSPKELEEFKSAEVKTEVPTKAGRRIDMVISTKNFYLPFEVKIWAGDQDAQLWDYYAFAKKQEKDVPAIYYLTPDGHEPSTQSRTNPLDAKEQLSSNQICLLSFSGHILRWLEDCMKDSDIPSDVRGIMIQLHDNIKGQPGIQSPRGSQGFSRWKEGGDDVLDTICQMLSNGKGYELPWTECTSDYMTFTLRKEKFEKSSLEFALRIKKEGEALLRLCLICGLTGEDGKTDYASAGDYISEHRDHFETLLNRTFREGGFKNQVKSGKTTWNRLPGGACCENAEKCFLEIEKIFGELLSQKPV